jgi:hypothetical protein
MPSLHPTLEERYRAAARLLGSGHPLTKALRQERGAALQACVLGAILVGSAIAALAGASWLVASAAAATLGVWLLATAAIEQRARTAALEIIVAGGEKLPLDAVQRQRERLLATRTRTRLSKVFARYAAEPSHVPAFGPRNELIAAEPLRDELLAVAALLRTRDVAAPGVARAALFLGQGHLVTHGSEVDLLRVELHRVIVSLAGDRAAEQELGEQESVAASRDV